MINNNKRKFQENNSNAVLNHNIRARSVLLIDQNGDNRGQVDIQEALQLAREASLDLLQVGTGKIVTCKIVDYGKLKYQESKQKKKEEKINRENKIETHEIKIRPVTNIADLEVKAKKIKEFLDQGDRVKISVVFKSREFQHKEIGIENLYKLVDLSGDFDWITHPADDPDFNGKMKAIHAMITSKKS